MFKKWQNLSYIAQGRLRSGIAVTLDDRPPSQFAVEEEHPEDSKDEKSRKRANLNKARLATLDVDYSGMKSHVRKGLDTLASKSSLCAVCSRDFDAEEPTMLVCPKSDCSATSHMSCLARRFIEEQEAVVLPTSGPCPTCKTIVHWIDLIKELSLRTRGSKELSQLFKKPRQRKMKTKKDDNGLSFEIVVEETDNDHDDEVLPAANVDDEPLPDDWHRFEDEEDAISVTSLRSDVSSAVEPASPYKSGPAAPRLKLVIEESDWDGAEVLD